MLSSLFLYTLILVFYSNLITIYGFVTFSHIQNKILQRRSRYLESESRPSIDTTTSSINDLQITTAATDTTSSISSSSSTQINDSSLAPVKPAEYDMTGLTSSNGDTCPIPAREFQRYNSSSSRRIAFDGPVSHQVQLSWTNGIKRILVLVKPDDSIIPSLVEAIDFMRLQGIEILLEKQTAESLKDQPCLAPVGGSYPRGIDILSSTLLEGVDLVMALGGDGLIMHANTIFAEGSVPPVMCFDFGSLGFLAPFKFEDLQEQLTKIMSGEPVQLTLRMRLDCTITRMDGSTSSYSVLNEALIDRGASPFLSNLELLCDNEYLTTVQGDGIIFATPTGSTAYSLAAGGSMVHPSIPAILLTPICPHTLSFRPLVLPDSAILRCIIPKDGRSSAMISFDGKHRQELCHGDMVDIRFNSFPVPTINKDSYTSDWFQSLRTSFMFNERAYQKPMDN